MQIRRRAPRLDLDLGDRRKRRLMLGLMLAARPPVPGVIAIEHAAIVLLCLLAWGTAPPSALATTAAPTSVAIPIDERGQRAAGIATTPVEVDAAGLDISFPGAAVVPPHQSSVIASPAAGMMETVLVAQDEPVKAGQVLALLRSPQVVEAQHLYLAALTDERLAADKLRRAEALFKAKAMSEVQLVLARGEHAHALARVDERLQILQLMGVAQADIDELRQGRKISNAIEIRAPREGTVTERNVKQGTRVEAAAPLFTIATLSPLWINIQVPTARMALLREGKAVALPAQGARGRIIRVGRSIDAATQSIGVIAEIDTNGGSVRPGLATSVTIRIDNDTRDRWSVPIASVVRHRDRSWIFVQSQRGFDAKPVEVVSEMGTRAAIRADLAPTDRIAAQGVMALVAELAEIEGQ